MQEEDDGATSKVDAFVASQLQQASTMPRKETCRFCGGDGVVILWYDDNVTRCPYCDGSGFVERAK